MGLLDFFNDTLREQDTTRERANPIVTPHPPVREETEMSRSNTRNGIPFFPRYRARVKPLIPAPTTKTGDGGILLPSATNTQSIKA